jgi:hypothetical protein
MGIVKTLSHDGVFLAGGQFWAVVFFSSIFTCAMPDSAHIT